MTKLVDIDGMLSIRVLFFGRLADLVTQPEFEYSISPGSTLIELYEELCTKNADLPSLHEDSSLNVAQNQSLADWQTPIEAKDEIAFLPPVTGG